MTKLRLLISIITVLAFTLGFTNCRQPTQVEIPEIEVIEPDLDEEGGTGGPFLIGLDGMRFYIEEGFSAEERAAILAEIRALDPVFIRSVSPYILRWTRIANPNFAGDFGWRMDNETEKGIVYSAGRISIADELLDVANGVRFERDPPDHHNPLVIMRDGVMFFMLEGVPETEREIIIDAVNAIEPPEFNELARYVSMWALNPTVSEREIILDDENNYRAIIVTNNSDDILGDLRYARDYVRRYLGLDGDVLVAEYERIDDRIYATGPGTLMDLLEFAVEVAFM